VGRFQVHANALKGLDANEVYPGIWQGSVPPEGSALANLGFKGLVLCAMEHQPAASRFSGIQVLHAPNDDDFERLPTREELRLAFQAARGVAKLVSDGLPVLVTCRMGKNRSGLVSALAIHFLAGLGGMECLFQVRSHRKGALGNPGFQEALSRLQATSS